MVYAYIYVGHQNALKRYIGYMKENRTEFDKLKDKEKTWRKYSGGFFVLLSSIM